jgi:co-chaperonin GroES (HSP10)
MSFDPIQISEIRALRDHVLVADMNFSERTLASGIVLAGDDAKTSGIRPRWAKVYAVGPEQKDILVGQWILVAHGRWTRGIKIDINGETMTLRRVDTNDILLISDEEPTDENFSTAISV